MRKKLALSITLIILGILWPGSARALPSAAGEAAFADFAAELEEIQQALQIPGLSAAIVKDQQLVWAQGFGYADVENSIPATADTPYHFASVTKPIAATLLMQLVEEDRLTLDDPVQAYGVSLQNPDITVWHLLTHTSAGIPGSSHDYDGNRYSYLGRVMAGASGKSFGRLLSERILQPLEMTQTAPNVSWADGGVDGYLATTGLGELYQQLPAVYQDMAKPYQFDSSYHNVPGAYPHDFSPAAGLIGSVIDIAKFDVALDNDLLLRPETKALMFTPAVANDGQPLIYGLGWYSQTYEDTKLIWHSGGWTPSVSALYLKVPEENLTFIALANHYNMTRPYPFDSGDVLYSTPALAFYKHFVFPQQTGKSVPRIDWSADAAALLSQLEMVSDPEIRSILERELWSYRKLFGSVGAFDQADILLTIHRRAFPEFYMSRYDETAVSMNGPASEPQPVSLLPHQVVFINRLLLVWVVVTIGSLLYLLVDFWRGNAWPRPFKAAWFLVVSLFGLIGLSAYLASGDQHSRPHLKISRWRQALGPALFSTTGNMAGLTIALLIISRWFPDTPGALPAIAGMFLAGWVLFRTPLAAGILRLPYGQMLRWSFWPELGSTFFVLLGSFPVLLYLTQSLLLSLVPGNPQFLFVLLVTAVAGALVVYPYTFWLIGRQRRKEKKVTTMVVPT